MRPTHRSVLVALALAASTAFSQTPTPTFSVVNTGLDATFGNAGKGISDPQVAGITGVAFGADLFVVVGNSTNEDVIRWATSPDGTTWTARSQAIGGGMKTFTNSKVHFLNGKFMFFAAHSTPSLATTWVYTSADGLTWTQNKVADARLGFEEFDSSPTLTVVGGSNGGQVASSDLVTWTSRPVVPNGVGYDHLDVAYGSGQFFSSINGFGGTTYTSTDGVTWTNVTGAAIPGGSRVETGNSLVIINAGAVYYRSTDGTTFTKITPTIPTGWLGQGPVTRFTGGRFLCTAAQIVGSTIFTGYLTSTDGLSWSSLGLLPTTPAAAPGTSRLWINTDIAFGNGKYVQVGVESVQTFSTRTTLPLILTLTAAAAPPSVTEPQSQAVTAGGSATLSTAATGTIQWQRNGANLSGATTGTLALTNVQPANTGIYTAAITSGATTTLQHAIIGVSTTSKVIGTATEFTANVPHPNGNVFDLILFNGAAAAFTSDVSLNQAIRATYIDMNDDIVQIEFAGAGTVAVVFDGSSGPAAPINYNQPSVPYIKGHAGIVVTGANETTNLTIFTVGRATAFDPSGAYNILVAPNTTTNNPANNGSPLFTGKSATVYDGVADIAFVAISSTNGKFGGLRTAGASYFATKGLTGVYASGITFTGPLFVGDITASDAATPVLQVGSVSVARITGGDLLQTNGQAVQVSGITQLKFTAGTNSHGVVLPAQTNKAVLMQNGTNVTTQIVVNP